MELNPSGLSTWEALLVLYWTLSKNEIDPKEDLAFAIPESVQNRTPALARAYIGSRLNTEYFLDAIKSDFGVHVCVTEQNLIRVQNATEDLEARFCYYLNRFKSRQHRLEQNMGAILIFLIVALLMLWSWWS